MISAVITGDVAARDRLRRIGDEARSAIARAVAKLGRDLRTNVSANKPGGGHAARLRPETATAAGRAGTNVNARAASSARHSTARHLVFARKTSVRAHLLWSKSAFRQPLTASSFPGGEGRRNGDFAKPALFSPKPADITAAVGAAIEQAVPRSSP
jgi:hypothetical protein